MFNTLAASLFSAVMATSWLALMLADRGKFSGWACLTAGLATGIATFAVLFRKPRDETTSVQSRAAESLHALVALIIALSTLISTHQPGELLSGGWDPGVYLHTGAQISETGALMNTDPDLLKLTEDEAKYLRRYQSGCVGPFAGMWLVPAGGMSPQFHHLYPALLGVAHFFGGLHGELLVNPLLNVGCILALYALARRFVRAPFALAAVVALALNPAQVWQAKFSTAEMLGQFLMLGGAVFFLSAMNGDGLTPARPADGVRARRLHALLAGAAFGLAFLARYDSIIFLAPFVALLIGAWPWLPNRANAALVLAGAIPFAIHHLIRKPIFSPYYTPMGNIVLPALCVLIALAAAFAIVMRNTKLCTFAEQRVGWLRGLAAAGVLVWAVFIWARPYLGELPLLLKEDAKNCYFLSAIFGPLTFAFFAALVAWIFTERNIVRALWLYSSVAVLMVVTTSIFNDHYLMWVSRRFIPVVIPLLVIAFAVVLDRFAGTTRVRHLIAAGCLVVVIGANIPATLAMQRLRDWPGLANWTASVAAAIPDDARVFSDQWGFAAPQRFLHGKRAYELHISERDPRRRDFLLALMNAAVARGEKVYFLTMRGPLGTCEERGRFPLVSQRLDSSTTGVPRTTRPAGGDFVLYEIRPP